MTPEELEIIHKLQQMVDKRDQHSCWKWLGPRNKHGVGEYRANGRVVIARDLAWLIFYDSIPEHKAVRNNCETIDCVNPNHLYLDEKKKGVIYDPKPLPSDFRELNPGTYEWKEFWQKFPEKQEEMIRYRKEI